MVQRLCPVCRGIINTTTYSHIVVGGGEKKRYYCPGCYKQKMIDECKKEVGYSKAVKMGTWVYDHLIELGTITFVEVD